MILNLLHRPPKPCHDDVPSLSIDNWIILLIMVGIIYGYMVIKKNNLK